MAETKYGKYIVRGIGSKESMPGVMPSAFGEPEDWAGIKHRMKWDYVSMPVRMEEAHSHDFDEFLVFLGGNPRDPGDFDADIEISLGEEGEKPDEVVVIGASGEALASVSSFGERSQQVNYEVLCHIPRSIPRQVVDCVQFSTKGHLILNQFQKICKEKSAG